MDVGWDDLGNAGGHGRSVLSLWDEGGWAWAEVDCGGMNALHDCYPPLLSPQEC